MPRLRREALQLVEQAQALAAHADNSLSAADRALITTTRAILAVLQNANEAIDQVQEHGIEVWVEINGRVIPAKLRFRPAGGNPDGSPK